ncbi:unnamed protein product [Amoebophrya sp. A120]|nr:unnamed protein product [Amoebophrya sp. A120]|eukprot:GSA120T00002822001.1
MLPIFSGLLAGAVCVLAPDHLAPVLSLSFTDVHDLRSAFRIGFQWGIGHSSGILVVVFVVLLLRVTVTHYIFEVFVFWSQVFVGSTLLSLGVYYFFHQTKYLSTEEGTPGDGKTGTDHLNCACCAFPVSVNNRPGKFNLLKPPDPDELEECCEIIDECEEIAPPKPLSFGRPQVFAQPAFSADKYYKQKKVTTTGLNPSVSNVFDRALGGLGGGNKASAGGAVSSGSGTEEILGTEEIVSTTASGTSGTEDDQVARTTKGSNMINLRLDRLPRSSDGSVPLQDFTAARGNENDAGAALEDAPEEHGSSPGDERAELLQPAGEVKMCGLTVLFPPCCLIGVNRLRSPNCTGRFELFPAVVANSVFCIRVHQLRTRLFGGKASTTSAAEGALALEEQMQLDEASQKSRLMLFLGFLQGFSCPSNLMSLLFVAKQLNWFQIALFMASYCVSSCCLMGCFCYVLKVWLFRGGTDLMQDLATATHEKIDPVDDKPAFEGRAGNNMSQGASSPNAGRAVLRGGTGATAATSAPGSVEQPSPATQKQAKDARNKLQIYRISCFFLIATGSFFLAESLLGFDVFDYIGLHEHHHGAHHHAGHEHERDDALDVTADSADQSDAGLAAGDWEGFLGGQSPSLEVRAHANSRRAEQQEPEPREEIPGLVSSREQFASAPGRDENPEEHDPGLRYSTAIPSEEQPRAENNFNKLYNSDGGAGGAGEEAITPASIIAQLRRKSKRTPAEKKKQLRTEFPYLTRFSGANSEGSSSNVGHPEPSPSSALDMDPRDFEQQGAAYDHNAAVTSRDDSRPFALQKGKTSSAHHHQHPKHLSKRTLRSERGLVSSFTELGALDPRTVTRPLLDRSPYLQVEDAPTGRTPVMSSSSRSRAAGPSEILEKLSAHHRGGGQHSEDSEKSVAPGMQRKFSEISELGFPNAGIVIPAAGTTSSPH